MGTKFESVVVLVLQVDDNIAMIQLPRQLGVSAKL